MGGLPRKQWGSTINGGSSGDLIAAGLNNDSVRAFGGNDRVWGGSGNDTVNGDDGNDTIRGGTDNDSLLGGNGNDILFGGTGNDVLSGGAGADSLVGGQGDDFLNGGLGPDSLWGGAGSDSFYHYGNNIHFGTEWIFDYQDYTNDKLVMTSGGGINDFTFNTASSTGRGSNTEELFITYVPLNRVAWVLVDGDSLDNVEIQTASGAFTVDDSAWL